MLKIVKKHMNVLQIRNKNVNIINPAVADLFSSTITYGTVLLIYFPPIIVASVTRTSKQNSKAIKAIILKIINFLIIEGFALRTISF